MPVNRRLRRPWLAAALAMCLLAACGGSDDDGGSAASKDDIVAEVASFDLAVGPPSRLIVGVQTNDRRFVVFGTVQFRIAYLGTEQDSEPGDYGPPAPARFLALPGVKVPTPAPADPVFASGSEARGVYAAAVSFPRAGYYQVEVKAKVAGEERTATAAMAVNERHAIPAPGEPALPTENLTVATTDAPRAAIDSRAATGEIPDTRLHQTTVAAALAAKRPAVVVFSTPVYCQSQFCGPVTDVVDGLAATYGDRASFVHIEIWRDFQGRVLNKSAADWLFRDNNLNEPWVFVLNADGTIAARFDNVVTTEEIEPLLRQLPVIGPAT